MVKSPGSSSTGWSARARSRTWTSSGNGTGGRSSRCVRAPGRSGTRPGGCFTTRVSSRTSPRANARAGELREYNQFQQEIISGAGEGIVVLNPELRYTVFNSYMEKMTGLKPERVLGRRCFDVFPFLRQHGFEELLRRATAGETVSLVRRPVPHRGDGAIRMGDRDLRAAPQRRRPDRGRDRNRARRHGTPRGGGRAERERGEIPDPDRARPGGRSSLSSTSRRAPLLRRRERERGPPLTASLATPCSRSDPRRYRPPCSAGRASVGGPGPRGRSSRP